MARKIIHIILWGVMCGQRPLLGQDALPAEAATLISSAKESVARSDIQSAVGDFHKAFVSAKAKTDTDQIALASFQVGKDLFEKENGEAAEQFVDLAVAALEATGDDGRILIGIKLGVRMGETYKRQGMTVRYLRELDEYYAKRGDAAHEEEALTEILRTPDGDAGNLPLDVLLRLEKLYTDRKNALGLAEIHTALAAIKQNRGDVEGAAEECKAAISEIKEHKIDDPSLARLYDHCGLVLREKGEYAVAKDYLEAAVKMEHDPTELGSHQFNLALIYLDLGQTQRAIEEAKTSVETVRGSKVRADLAKVLIGVAGIYANSGQLDAALAAVDEARVIAREDGLEDLKRSALERLGEVRDLQGKSTSAAADLDRTSEMARNGNGGGLETASAWRTRAMALLVGGDDKSALLLFKEAVKRADGQHDLDELAQARQGLAEAYGHLGDFGAAETPLLANLQYYRQRRDTSKTTGTLELLANLYVEMGRYYDALDQYVELQKLIEVGGGNGSVQRRLAAKLAASEIQVHLLSYEKALRAAEEAIALSAESGFKEYGARAERLAGRVCLAQGDFSEARKHFLNAEKLDYRGMVFNEGLVEVYLGTHDFKGAMDELGKVKEENLQQASDDLKARFYTQRGLARLGAGDVNGAVKDFNDAIGLIEYARLGIVGRHSVGYLDAGEFGSRTRAYQGMMEAFANFWLLGDKDEDAKLGNKHVKLSVAALHYAELGRGRSQFDNAKATREDALFARLPKALQEKQEHIVAEKRRLGAELEELDKRGEMPSAAQVAAANKLREEAGEFIQAIRRDVPEYDFEPGWSFVESLALPEHEVILEYAIGLQTVYLFVIRKQGIELVALPDSIEHLASQVRVFRDLLAAGRYSREKAEKLYGNLLGRVDEYLKPTDSVLIIPDGFLGVLPFEALVRPMEKEESPAGFFGAIHLVAYAQSISSMALARMISRPVGSKLLFAVADPIFDRSDERYQQEREDAGVWSGAAGQDSRRAGGGYRRLPETAAEVKAIATVMGGKAEPPDVLIGAAANKESVLTSELGSYRYIHLATHAAALGEFGLVNEPFFVLGVPQSGRFEDQIVTMSEVMKLRLSAQLVVLAACETGRGDALRGDGVASLASAFLYAGANNVLLSLWEVPSRASVLFMQKFYGYLHEGKSEREALRLTKDAMRAEYPNPYYWAVFVLYESGDGGWRGLRSDQRDGERVQPISLRTNRPSALLHPDCQEEDSRAYK
jgi:CHAT domain-containing protein